MNRFAQFRQGRDPYATIATNVGPIHPSNLPAITPEDRVKAAHTGDPTLLARAAYADTGSQRLGVSTVQQWNSEASLMALNPTSQMMLKDMAALKSQMAPPGSAGITPEAILQYYLGDDNDDPVRKADDDIPFNFESEPEIVDAQLTVDANKGTKTIHVQ